MGHRALVAYERTDGQYTLHYSHWGAANLKLNHRISAESPFSGDDTDSAWAKQLLADYVALGEGCDEWLIILCAQDDRAYPAPLDYRTLPIENDPVPPFRNSLGRVTISLNRKRGGFLMKNIRLSLAAYQLIERAVGALERIGRELKRYNDREAQVSEETAESMPMNEKLVKRE